MKINVAFVIKSFQLSVEIALKLLIQDQQIFIIVIFLPFKLIRRF